MVSHRDFKRQRRKQNALLEEISEGLDLVGYEVPNPSKKIEAYSLDDFIPIILSSFYKKIPPHSSLPDKLSKLHAFVANVGSAQQRHGFFQHVPRPIWEFLFKNVTLYELTAVLSNPSLPVSSFMGYGSLSEESFVLKTREERQKYVDTTLDYILEQLEEAPDFVDISPLFGGLESKLNPKVKELFKISLEEFVLGLILAISMDDYNFREKAVELFNGKTLWGDPLHIGGGESFLIDLEKAKEYGYSLSYFSSVNNSFSIEDIQNFINKGIIIHGKNAQKITSDNVKNVEWAYIRTRGGTALRSLGTSDTFSFLVASLTYGPKVPLVIRIMDNLDTIVKGASDYTQKKYHSLMKSASKHHIFSKFYNENKLYGEGDLPIIAGLFSLNEKVRRIAEKIYTSDVIETFIYLISKGNSSGVTFLGEKDVAFRSSIGMRHNHIIYNELSDLYLPDGTFYEESLIGNTIYSTLIKNPIFNLIGLGQDCTNPKYYFRQPVLGDMPVDYRKELTMLVLLQEMDRFEKARKVGLLPEKKAYKLSEPIIPGVDHIFYTGLKEKVSGNKILTFF